MLSHAPRCASHPSTIDTLCTGLGIHRISTHVAGLVPSPIEVKPTIFEQGELALKARKDAKNAAKQQKKEEEAAAIALVCGVTCMMLVCVHTNVRLKIRTYVHTYCT